MEKFDVLVIGAGPSGSVASSYLSKHGKKVLVVERAKFPRFVIGESLLPLSMGHFEEAGLLCDLKAQKFEVKNGAMFIRNGVVFDLKFSEVYTQGWTWTWQVPRAHFDKVLADGSEKNGTRFLYESTIGAMNFSEDSVKATVYTPDGPKEIEAEFVIDSSGNGGVLANMLSIPTEVSPTSNMSVFTHVKDTTRADFEMPTQITFPILEQDLWMWVIPFSNGDTSIGFAGNKKHFAAFTDDCDKTAEFRKLIELSPEFHERFGNIDLKFEPFVFRDFSKKTDRFIGHRFVLTGNTAEFLDPVFSSGVAFATESGMTAAKLVERQLNGENIDWQAEYVDHIQLGIDRFRTYVTEWYSGNLQTIFFNTTVTESIKRQITSILAGYVWDETNPFVAKHDTIIKTLAKVVEIENS